MRNDDVKFRAMAKRLIRAGVPLHVPVASSSPPLTVKELSDYDACEIFDTASGDTAIILNLQISFSRKTFVEELSLELPWGGELDDWLQGKRHPKTGCHDYGFSPGRRYPATMVLNSRLSGSKRPGTVLQGLLLGISYSAIPDNFQNDETVTAQLHISCAPDITISHPIQMRVGRRLSRIRCTPAPRRHESLFEHKNTSGASPRRNADRQVDG